MSALVDWLPPMYVLSCASLTFVGFVCLIGTFWRGYRDNLLQRVGMAVLIFGCAARVKAIWAAQTVATDWFMVHGAIALIAAGTVVKTITEIRQRRRCAEERRNS